MKNTFYKIAGFYVLFILFESFTSIKPTTREIVLDIVCGMKVNTAESYDLKHNGKTYYFDSYDCREAFKQNPRKFLYKKCTPNDNIIDLVCGVKVNLAESYDLKHAGKVYHFHSVNCKEAFKMNPEKFIKNKCAPKDSIK